ETREESSSERAGDELESDKSKKQKLDEKVEAEVDDVKEAEELKQCLEIALDDGDDVTIDATPLFVKILNVNYKIHHEGKKSFFQIIRADVQSIPYYLLVKKMYPLTKHTLHQMFNDVKLQVDYECGMACELLRLVKKHLKEGY
ncbi:hypothetical protein Tco_1197831, partial [Tanacetum coccineum]